MAIKLKKSKTKVVFLTTLHALIIMLFFWLWLSLPFSYEADSRIFQFCQLTKNIVFKSEQPDPNRFVFIDVSNDKMLIDQTDADGAPNGRIAITNRQHLATLLEALALTNKHQYIILDIFLEDSTAEDSALQASLHKIQRCIQPYHLDGEKTPKYSRFKSESGLADYSSDFGNFFKYTYIQNDTCRTVPLVMYENIHGKKLSRVAGFYFHDGTLSLNSIALDLRIRQHHIINNRVKKANAEDTTIYNLTPMYNLGNLPPPILQSIVSEYQNKIIVIGDFQDRDIHSTSYGQTAGPLIQLNAFLALEKEDNRLHWYGLLIIFLMIWLLCWFMPFLDNPEAIPFLARFRRGRFSLFFQVIQYTLILGVFSMVYFLVSGIYINTMIIGFYFGLREDIQEFFKSFFRK
jgi:hypothetical protein